MKGTVTILIFVGLLMQTTSSLIIIGQFYTNRDYIAKHLCVNRDKPKMKCCGRCYLRKELNQDEKNNGHSSTKNEKFQEIVFIVSQKYTIPLVHWIAVTDYPVIKDGNYYFTYTSDCFHPPSVA